MDQYWQGRSLQSPLSTLCLTSTLIATPDLVLRQGVRSTGFRLILVSVPEAREIKHKYTFGIEANEYVQIKIWSKQKKRKFCYQNWKSTFINYWNERKFKILF